MEKEDAVIIMNEIMVVNASLNKLLERIRAYETDAEITALSTGVLSTGMHIYKELMSPIIRQYPELDPDIDHV